MDRFFEALLSPCVQKCLRSGLDQIRAADSGSSLPACANDRLPERLRNDLGRALHGFSNPLVMRWAGTQRSWLLCAATALVLQVFSPRAERMFTLLPLDNLSFTYS